jgi:hypothetical protein
MSGEIFSSGIVSTASVASLMPDTGITTDTGDFTPGRGYARYTTPLACVTAAANAQAFAQHARALQIQHDAGFIRPDEDTLPAAVVTVARKCGARFTPANTATADLPDLFTLALWEANDTLAQATLAALLMHAGTPKARGERLIWAVQQYLGLPVADQPARSMPPANVGAAEAVAQQVDALGEAEWDLKLQAHAVLLGFGRAYAEWPLVERQGARVIALTRDHLARPGLDSLWTAYQTLLRVAWLEQPDSVPAVAARLRTEFSQPVVQHAMTTACQATAPSTTVPRQAPCATLAEYHESSTIGNTAGAIAIPITDSTPLAALTTAAMGTAVVMGEQFYAPRALPPLHADYWFPVAKGGVAGDSLHPAIPGRVTLIYRVDGAYCQSGCPEVTNQLQALLAQYRTELAVTVVVDAAAGYTVLDVPTSPDSVAQSYRWLFQQYLGLPVAVAVRIRPVKSQRPSPDGRIEYANKTAYNDLYSEAGGALVTNRSGEVIYETRSLKQNAGRVRLATVVKHEEAKR